MIPKEFGHYKAEATISTHGQSVVIGGRSIIDDQVYACKFVRRDKMKKDDMLMLEHELRIHSFLNHPNVIKFKEVIYTKDFIIIVTEYCEGGDLLENVKNDRFTGTSAIRLFYEILSGVEYLHEKGFCHLDLKPENIFIDKEGKAKIGDFGCCIEANKFNSSRIVGTLTYMAPELLLPDYTSYDPKKCDVWSLGLIFYIMMTKSMPYRAESDLDLMDKIKKGDIYNVVQIPKKINDVIESCLKIFPKDRLTIGEIKKLNIFGTERRKEQTLLEQSSARRPARQLNHASFQEVYPYASSQKDHHNQFFTPKKLFKINFIGKHGIPLERKQKHLPKLNIHYNM